MKEYLKMTDVFPHAKLGKSPVKPWVSGEYFVFYENQAKYAAHAIDSHDELVAEVERLQGIIDRVISTANELSLKSPTSPWGDGYKECALSTARALEDMTK